MRGSAAARMAPVLRCGPGDQGSGAPWQQQATQVLTRRPGTLQGVGAGTGSVGRSSSGNEEGAVGRTPWVWGPCCPGCSRQGAAEVALQRRDTTLPLYWGVTGQPLQVLWGE